MQNCFFAFTFYDHDVEQLLLTIRKIIGNDSVVWQLPSKLHMTILYCYTLDDKIINHVDIIKPKSLSIKGFGLKSLANKVVIAIEPTEVILDIYENLKSKMQEQKIDTNPFIPHVTVAHNFNLQDQISCELILPVKNIVLLKSKPFSSSYYQVKKF